MARASTIDAMTALMSSLMPRRRRAWPALISIAASAAAADSMSDAASAPASAFAAAASARTASPASRTVAARAAVRS